MKPAKSGLPRRFPKPDSSARPLTARERRFVEEYLVDLMGEHAAIRAGYSPKTARVQASQVLTRPNIQAALEAGYKERQARMNVTADTTVRELSRLAHADIRQFYDPQGQLIPIHLLPDDLAACIASIEVVVRRNRTSGDGTTETVHKVRLWSKPQALELLGRHQGLFREDGQLPVADAPAFCLPDGFREGPSVH